METIKIYADGSCLGNPGPGGWACILVYKQTTKTISGGASLTTNNQMELTAVIEALKALKKTDIPVEIFVDSNYVYKGITEHIQTWLANGRKTATKTSVKNIELWQELYNLTLKFKISRNWTKAHANDIYNNLIDKIARSQAKKFAKENFKN